MKDGLTQEDLNEDCPILMQKDFQTTIKNIADLPDYLRKINENIINIDKRISKKELNTEKVKQLNMNYSNREHNSKCNNDLYELNNIVKQSIDGLYGILGVKKDPIVIEPIEEEVNVNKGGYNKHNKAKAWTKDKNKGQVKDKVNTSLTSPPYKKTSHKKIIEPSKSYKTSNKANENLLQINKGNTTNDNGNQCNKNNINVNHKEPNDNPLNTTYTTFTHEQSMKNIGNANARGLASSSDIINGTYLNDNSIPKANSFKSKDSTKAINKGAFCFKPRTKKDSLNNINNIDNDLLSKKALTNSLSKSNTFKNNQMKSSAKVLESNHQRLFTEQSKPSSNKNTSSSALKPQEKITITRNSPTKNMYSNEKDTIKGATTKDILSLMLFFNEYILSTNTIKSKPHNSNVLESISIELSKALNSIEGNPYHYHRLSSNGNNKEEEGLNAEEGLMGLSNDKLVNSVLKLQRKWRRYKVRDIIFNSSLHNVSENSLIKNMIINNFIEKEGFGAKKLIGMINSTIESFLLLKGNIIRLLYILGSKGSTDQLSDLALNRVSDEDRHKLYKTFINRKLGDANNNHYADNQSNTTLRHSLNEQYHNSILSKIKLSDTKPK